MALPLCEESCSQKERLALQAGTETPVLTKRRMCISGCAFIAGASLLLEGGIFHFPTYFLDW
jgi:hypothetical protein